MLKKNWEKQNLSKTRAESKGAKLEQNWSKIRAKVKFNWSKIQAKLEQNSRKIGAKFV